MGLGQGLWGGRKGEGDNRLRAQGQDRAGEGLEDEARTAAEEAFDTKALLRHCFQVWWVSPLVPLSCGAGAERGDTRAPSE